GTGGLDAVAVRVFMGSLLGAVSVVWLYISEFTSEICIYNFMWP
ncbi:MAG: hypothetical protein ACD_23C00794G0002, partial [uncultured bacterium]